MKIKASKNFSFKKASGLLLGIVADTLNDMIKYQNSAIQDGIKTSTDINGDSFEKLSEDSTLPIRVKRGHGFTPLFTMKKEVLELLALIFNLVNLCGQQK